MEKTVKEQEIASVKGIMIRAYFEAEYNNEATLLVFADGDCVCFKKKDVTPVESVSSYVRLAERGTLPAVSIRNAHYFDEMTRGDWRKELEKMVEELNS
jgi:hypothetical protein